MNDWQLFAVIGVPSLITLIGMAQNSRRFEAIEKRMDGIDKRIDGLEASLRAEISLIRHDLQQFFRDLGRHEEAIEILGPNSNL